MDRLQDETRQADEVAQQQVAQRGDQGEALQQQVSATAAGGNAAAQARADFRTALAECVQRQGSAGPSHQPRQRHREAEGCRVAALLGITLPCARGRDGAVERRGGRGRRVHADEPLAQDRRTSRE